MNKSDFTILYVDDEEHNLISFKACFRREYKILTAIGGDEGLEIMRHHDVDLIITDQRMPKMTGIQFLERILSEYPDTVRMILTGFSDVEAIIGAINSGRVLRYVSKPWDENDLRTAIENARQLLELSKSNKALLFTLQKKVEEQERTLKLFRRYVPEAVVEKALLASDETIFDGELKHVTLLFCDIRGFTSMSEELSPKEVVALLNDYYTLMTEAVTRHNGTVNQFVGDEVFAAFGAPRATLDNEKNAVFCALEMVQKLETLNQKYQERVGREILVGIGINAGEVVAGNVGSEARIEYHFTGDTVNTGKRIEVVSRDYPNAILMSESVYSKTTDVVRTKEFEPIMVKGKKEKIQVYQVLGRV
ncbi:MAG: adenylate/guanylate cyclase domain-containing protein [candidate division KSB1 bacterium]